MTTIEWTDVTWNPTTGCDRVSPGCDHCYALALAKRLKAMGSARYQTDGNPKTSGPGFGLALHPAALNAPRHWRTPRRVFVNSMSDLFHAEVPVSYLAEVWRVMDETQRHTYQILTKRAERMERILTRGVWAAEGWVLPNVWLGVSVETMDHYSRIRHLLRTPAAIRFLSCEPLLGPLPYLPLNGIHWVIVGGESGPGARPVETHWVRSIRDQCQRAGVAFFFKQWGGIRPKSGGRDLDGRTWDEMPNPRP